MTRRALPFRRPAELLTFDLDGRRWTATFGRFADGDIAEVFIDAAKASALADLAREAAVVTSIALQHGASASAIRHAIRSTTPSPLARALDLFEGHTS